MIVTVNETDVSKTGESVRADAPQGGQKIIEIDELNKWFGEFHVLKDISLSVNKAEVVVIIGPSGSGKSTLIRCVNRLEEHQQGKITVDGVELTDDVKKIDQIRRETGMVFQQFNLFPHLTVLENIVLAPIRVRKWKRSKAEERARYFLEKVGIPEQADKYPRSTFGRSAAACSDCPGADDGTQSHAFRRADLRPRPRGYR